LLKMSDDGPPAPPGLPEYVRDGLEARTPEQLRAVADWAESLAARKERVLEEALERPPEEDGEVAATHRYAASELAEDVDDGDLDLGDATGTVYLYWIETYCNKDNCSTCPHGPYPYVKYRVDDTVRTRYGTSVASERAVTPPE
jgi:hypothetical protein